mgnify:CR=1 FL=1
MRTMKIEEDVATRLAVLKRKFKRKSFSDLLESFCDFFEESRLKPTDLDSARRPPSLVITERTNRIISFIKTSEEKYLKEILNLVEKLYVQMEKNNLQLPETAVPKKQDKKSVQVAEPPKEIVAHQDQFIELKTELKKAKSEKGELEYRLENQNKFMKELLSKFKKQSMTGNWTISNEQYQHYKEELSKL